MDGSAGGGLWRKPCDVFIAAFGRNEIACDNLCGGDLYDGDWPDFNTGLFFVRQMGRLRQAGIAVYLLYGNHDAENEITKRLELPDNVWVFSSGKAQTFRIGSSHRRTQ